jgi:multiple sugar transport system ATP-binding protein
VIFDEEVVNELSPRERDIAMVFQDYALYPHMSVFQNMAFPLELRGEKRDEIRARVNETGKTLGISQLMDRRPMQLSGGQRQRVAVGRAIVRRPAVFLLDEPLSNLDAALRVEMRTEIKRIQKDLAVTTLFVTHDQEEAMVMAEDIAIMRDGVIHQFGPPAEVYRDPVNLYVATFVGSPAMNLLPGSMKTEGGQVVFTLGGKDLRFPGAAIKEENLSKGVSKDNVVLGVRPENVNVSRTQEGAHVSSSIDLVEPVGPLTYVDMMVDSTEIKAATDPLMDLMMDENVGVTFAEEHVYFFDPATEERF